MLETLGLVIVVATVLFGLWFHMSWRKDVSRGWWPAPMLWSVGGALAVGFGLMVGSWMLVAGGCVTHLHGRRSAHRLGRE